MREQKHAQVELEACSFWLTQYLIWGMLPLPWNEGPWPEEVAHQHTETKGDPELSFIGNTPFIMISFYSPMSWLHGVCVCG